MSKIHTCPKCNKETLEDFNTAEGVVVDFCTGCKGVWFDSGELELLLEAAELENHDVFLERIIHAPEASSPEKKRRCPICTKKMKKAHIDEDKQHCVISDNQQEHHFYNQQVR